jgi:hypothetical protein
MQYEGRGGEREAMPRGKRKTHERENESGHLQLRIVILTHSGKT